MQKRIKIMIVEDQKLIRVGLRSLFEGYSQMEVVAEAQNGKEAVEKARQLNPDVVLIDVDLEDISGIDASKKILEQNPSAKIIVLTAFNDEKYLNAALSAGASAYIMKDIDTEILMMIIETVSKGAMWLDPQVVPYIREKNGGVIPSRQMSRADFRENHSNLTQREYEVLKLVVDGKSNNDIAQILMISEHTAKAHVCNIIQKLVVDDRTQAAVKALREGLV